MAQTPRQLTPHASLRHFFGAELRHWRQLANLSHDRLGAQINYSGDTISFLISTFGVGAGALVGLESTEASRLGREDVTAWERTLSQLRELDDQYGGGVYELGLRSLKRLRRVLHQGSYGPSTGEALHTLDGELTRYVGSLAYGPGGRARPGTGGWKPPTPRD